MGLDGVAAWKRDLRKLRNNIKSGMADGLKQAADDNMTDSLKEAPEETGLMKSTAYVDEPKVGRDKVEVTLGYEADYSIYVHERLELQHQPPTKAKFLEDPITRNASKSEDTIEDGIRKAIR